MSNIKKFDEFVNEELFRNKLPNFEFDNKLKKITINVNGDKVQAFAGNFEGNEEEGDNIYHVNNFYFKTDKLNAEILKKHDVTGIEGINDYDKIITFKLKDGETLDCSYKIRLFSKTELKDWKDVEEGGYVTWKI